MRIILVGLYVLLFLILSMPYMAVEYFIAKKHPMASAKRQTALVKWGFNCVKFLSGVKLHVEGQENIPVDEPVLYVGNHRGIFDVVLTHPLCPGVTGFISKISIKKVPMLRVCMNRITCLFMDRDDIKQSLKVILTAIDHVKEGYSVFIFPEGTRNKNKEDSCDMAEFKEGSFKVAAKSGCKIVPVAITGTAELLEDHLPFVHSGHVFISFGQPVDMKELDKDTQKKIGEYCQGIVRDMLIQQKEAAKAYQK